MDESIDPYKFAHLKKDSVRVSTEEQRLFIANIKNQGDIRDGSFLKSLTESDLYRLICYQGQVIQTGYYGDDLQAFMDLDHPPYEQEIDQDQMAVDDIMEFRGGMGVAPEEPQTYGLHDGAAPTLTAGHHPKRASTSNEGEKGKIVEDSDSDGNDGIRKRKLRPTMRYNTISSDDEEEDTSPQDSYTADYQFDESYASLCNMGFNAEQCLEVLRQFRGNLDKATNYLLDYANGLDATHHTSSLPPQKATRDCRLLAPAADVIANLITCCREAEMDQAAHQALLLKLKRDAATLQASKNDGSHGDITFDDLRSLFSPIFSLIDDGHQSAAGVVAFMKRLLSMAYSIIDSKPGFVYGDVVSSLEREFLQRLIKVNFGKIDHALFSSWHYLRAIILVALRFHSNDLLPTDLAGICAILGVKDGKIAGLIFRVLVSILFFELTHIFLH